MTVCNATLVPELQHWFYEFVVNSTVNKYKIPIPVDIAESYLVSNNRASFIEMMFNDNYSYDHYYYLYKANPSWSCIPIHVLNRLQIYPGVGKYMKLDPDAVEPIPIDTTGIVIVDSTSCVATDGNIFNLQQNEKSMLNALLSYRQDATSVTLIDTTSVPAQAAVFNPITKILEVDYRLLPSCLCRLIYLYLDLKIHGHIDKYNNTDIVAQTMLTTCYEAYVLENYFNFVSARGI
jgi:hypothetical protein